MVLMSVASKTKMYTTVVLGIVVALSALPTWANTTLGTVSIGTVDQPVVSTQGTQDLSVLRAKLKERFLGISKEVVSLIKGISATSEPFHGSATVRTIDVSQGIGVKPANLSQDFFVDIKNDPYRTYINRLASYGVLSSSQKFYPHNYFRADDFAGLLAKLYQKSQGHVLDLSTVSGLSSTDGIMTKRMMQQALRSLDIDADVQFYGNPYDKLIRSEATFYLVRFFDVPALNLVIPKSVNSPYYYFSDIVDHPYATAINTLASLDIVSTQTDKFYPDNYLRHYDFAVLFVNSLLIAKNQQLPVVSSSSFADVESSASYLSQLSYATERGLLDYLITTKRGKLYFDPNAFITKHEVYQILSKSLDIQFVYDTSQADMEKMMRGELAELLVQIFGFEPVVSEEPLENEDVTILNKLRVLLSML